MTARRVIDGAILDGKITFWTVNFTKSQKQPHTDNTGNEWDLSLLAVWLLQAPQERLKGHNIGDGGRV